MLTIRLQRTGKRNNPSFRVILARSTSAANRGFVELLGSYSPKTKELVVNNKERLQYWISQHVSISPTVNNIFVTKGIVDGKKVTAFKIPKKEAQPETAAAPVTAAVDATPAQSAESPQVQEDSAPAVEGAEAVQEVASDPATPETAPAETAAKE